MGVVGIVSSAYGQPTGGGPMLAGVAWVIEQNESPTGTLHQRIDTTHVGATGHSLGGFGTSEVGADRRISTTASACGAIGGASMKGPTLMLCGGKDTNVPCDATIKQAYDGTSKVPTVLARGLNFDHASWSTYAGTKASVFEVAIVAWMRIQLVDDTALRSWFYRASCKPCTLPAVCTDTSQTKENANAYITNDNSLGFSGALTIPKATTAREPTRWLIGLR